MSAKPQMKKITESVFERKFDFRDEKAGAKLNHNRITRNSGGLLRQHLRGKTCESFTTDMAVKVKTVDDKDYYPDIVVVCGDDDDKNFSETKNGKSQNEFLFLRSIGLTIRLKEIYGKCDFSK